MLMNEIIFDLLHGLVDAESRLYVLCDAKKREEAEKLFRDTFTEGWDQAVAAVAKKQEEDLQDMQEDNPNPILSVNPTEDGFVVTLDPMFIAYQDGSYYDDEKGREILENALKAMRERDPKVRWHGYIQYEVSDLHGGDYIHYEVYSDEELRDQYSGRTFDFEGREDGIYSAITNYSDYEFPDPDDIDFFEHLEDTDAEEKDFRSICRVLLLNSKDLKDTGDETAVEILENALTRLMTCAEDICEDAVPEIKEIIDAWKKDPGSVLMDPDAK